MLSLKEISQKTKLIDIRKVLDERKTENRFINYLLEDKVPLSLCYKDKTIINIKSLDGKIITVYEKIMDLNSDYVILVCSNNDDYLRAETLFNDYKFNTFILDCGNSLKDYSKLYIDILCLIDYLKNLDSQKKIYLYGSMLGANAITPVLKTDVVNKLNAVILNQISLSVLKDKYISFCNEQNDKYNPKILNSSKNRINKIQSIDINLLDEPQENLKDNTIPLVFISNLDKTDVEYIKFLTVYNSTKGIKKILCLNKNNYIIDLKNNFYKIIDEIKKY